MTKILCRVCKQLLPANQFRQCCGKICEDCRRNYQRNRREALKKRRPEDIPIPKFSQCSSCSEIKKSSEFTPRASAKRGIDSHCKECIRKKLKKEYRNNKHNESWYKRRFYANRIKRYGITLPQYEQMLMQQKGKCAICRNPETHKILGKVVLLSVDHCHTTGQVRGLLCCQCNRAIGLFYNNIQFLQNAIDYLSWHEHTPAR